ncbi:LysR substrate-binding domain-containing protein [Burkholderia glumae]|uniref:LysR family transcriptional regulator n=1 Tax=Burkholderia glumae TaxID=337 RepID=A0AAP9XWL1_BURGL|nr:LysR substrate-binding domain-containing protein [Burkholderia glumae]AJY64100.1 bacterial regulatory helix-turn-helix, lysR family protein [Burkholderia glumae LMG 2196 = ATCC 33617]KHJ61594.1 LysR family transcriptional regulator [Burkholderia glumae]MCM2484528.1 LysR substrate-binding domain-containing protein [Burkholderia glumae]MCM2510220.1 LysR substrate-binding domain-containing protein [Burkholderia glumae]MCM2539985.1 LysR substrate-binding domain-containing protein [Burkholderia 
MTLTQIRAFLAVVQHGGFTAAARALAISQTTVTSQIQGLEQEHGVQLFHRRGRRVELSAVGLDFLPLARQIHGLEHDARSLLHDSGELTRGMLRIGAVSPFHVTEIIEAFHAAHPRLQLAVTLGNSESVLNDLDDYACEVGVIARSFGDARYEMAPYASYPVIAFVGVAHPFATRGTISLAELASTPLLMREPGSTTRRALEDALARLGATPRVAMEIGSREALREAVARGLGVGTVSLSEYVPDEARLRPVRIEGDPVSTHIHVCCLRERRDSRLVDAFFAAMRRCRPGAPRAAAGCTGAG